MLKEFLFDVFCIKNLDKSEFYANFAQLLQEDHINNHLKTYEFQHCGNGRPYG